MRLIRIAIANVNPTVGAVRANTDRALGVARAAAQDGATLVAFGEQLIAGYTTIGGDMEALSACSRTCRRRS